MKEQKKEQKNLPVRRNRKHTKQQIWLHVLPHVILIAGCFAVMISITDNVFGKESNPDKIISYEMISGEAIPESPVADTDDLRVDAEQADIQTMDPEWYLTLVNREHPLPENYMDDPISLVDVPGGEKVDERIYDPLMEMLNDAEDLGPIVVSGYRTPEIQQSLYDDKIKKYKKQGYSESEAVNLAQQWVAEPGTSEHQLGLAVDINGATYDIYLWLQENSYKYGFIFRYPGNKTHITNVAEEVWHYRYVGKEAAAEIHERGICLEEYLEGLQSPTANGQGSQGQDSQGTDSQELPVQDEASYELQNGEWVVIDTSSP